MENQGQLSLIKVLPPILSWENPLHTGICVGALNIISMVLCYMNMNFLYVITNFLFFYLITSFLYIKLLKFLNKEQKEEQIEDEDYYLVSKEKMQEIIAFLISKINIIYTKIKRCELSENYRTEIITLVSLYIIAIIGKYFSLFTLVWIGFNIVMGISYCESVLKIDLKKKSAPLLGLHRSYQLNNLIEQTKAYKNMITSKLPKHTEE